MKRLWMIYGASALMMPGTARADWQYTRWGMTPDQVVNASSGTATREAVSGDLKAPYQSGDYKFEVTFRFREGGLWSVDLAGVSGPQCYALTGDLKAKYGQPSEYHPMNETYWWLDRASGNQIMITTLASMKCIVHYEPLKTENNK